jgi:hypothetical protein
MSFVNLVLNVVYVILIIAYCVNKFGILRTMELYYYQYELNFRSALTCLIEGMFACYFLHSQLMS